MAACAERDTTSPRQISPSEAARNVVTAWPTCDATFNAIKTAAGNFFSSKRDAAFGLIADMSKDYKAGGQSQATAKGLDILARVAAARLTSAQIAGSDGGPLVTNVIACTDLRNTGPGAFDPSTALASGIFEIRTGGSTVPAFAYSSARGETAPIDPYQGGAVPLWGVEGTWNAGPTGFSRYLVYGYPLPGTGDVRDTGFELGTLPVGVNVNGLAVAVCSSAVNGDLTSANLLEHAGTEVLLTHNATFCAGHMTLGFARPNPVLQRLVQLITPKVAIAQTRDDEFIGGLPSGWSPFKVKHYANSGVGLTFLQQPANDTVYHLVTVKVQLVNNTGAPVVVTLTIAGNNGDPTTLVTQDGSGNWNPQPFLTAVTDGSGIATFVYGYSKAGGYTLTASGSIGGTFVSTQSVLSNLFQIKNK
ncbi:MAG TPA: hypothetical protein VNC18_10395 [Gemmatimonadaceae bacterium]|nr:hypothetical protein [Gemmatimonadaceae bacterium]